MGNQIAGIAPAQIYPVEHYFTGKFRSEYTFLSSMGSTRFFKVARAKCDEGQVVVKVFVKHDPSLPLEEYRERIEHIKKLLANAANCLPFQRVEIGERAAYLLRQYVRQSLYDRVSTRPFLTPLEKKWITFQILCALNQCHKQKICHGDIKLENILITSWNWILLSDFASFKPTHLPIDNPGDFTYFFDTSRRRTCYIAPERFIRMTLPRTTGQDEQDAAEIGLQPSHNQLLPEMDIFSAGCALLELWTERTAPFELSQLLSYKAGNRQLVEKHLQSIDNQQLQSLISSMIDLDPAKRKSAESYLAEERRRLFPEYFYSFLQLYLQLFCTPPIKTFDEKILALKPDIEHCIKALKYDGGSEALPADDDGLILIGSLVTSCIQSLQQENAKIAALEMLQRLSAESNSEIILDRIVPYVLFLVKSVAPKVQVFALETLAKCLSYVEYVPRSDSNIFPDYILPELVGLSDDKNPVLVRMGLARHIANFAMLAIRFLDEVHTQWPMEMPMERHLSELSDLQEIIRPAVVALLTDPKTEVKLTLLESNICDLCGFFGKDKANDYMLMHVLTYLNSDNWHLRASFFDNICTIVGYIGAPVAEKFLPLILKGFLDSQEFVIVKAIHAATVLVELGYFKNRTIREIFNEIACYLCHPNLWIRQEMVGLVGASASQMRQADMQCNVIAAIQPFLKNIIVGMQQYEALMDDLVEPIPREIFDLVSSCSDLSKLLKALEERKQFDGSRKIHARELDKSLIKVLERLEREGLNERIENQLLAMRAHFEGRSKENKRKHYGRKAFDGKQLILRRSDVRCFEFPLKMQTDVLRPLLAVNCRKYNMIAAPAAHPIVESPSKSSLEGQTDSMPPKNASPAVDVLASPIVNGGFAGSTIEEALEDTLSGSSLHTAFSVAEQHGTNYFQPACFHERDNLCIQAKRDYNAQLMSQQLISEKLAGSYSSSWRFKGTLISHLHEHSAAVTSLCSLSADKPVFASSGMDGVVRIWDCARMNTGHGVSRSRRVWKGTVAITTIAATDGGETIAVGGEDGQLQFLHGSSLKFSQQPTAQNALSGGRLGPIVDIHAYEQVNPNLVVYATLFGWIVAVDTRMSESVWRLRCDMQKGTISSICADSAGLWLAAGTSSGNHICWDLRFELQIADIQHPQKCAVRKIACHPTEPSCLISASKLTNEISIYNIETGSRDMLLKTGDPNSSTNAILGGAVNSRPFILTGGTDQRLRYLDLQDPRRSSVVVPLETDDLDKQQFSYSRNLCMGNPLEFVEQYEPAGRKLTKSEMESIEQPKGALPTPTHAHDDAVTALLMSKQDDEINIISASRDGVIKIWR